MKNPRVFIELQIGNQPVGEVVIELFADLVPKTAENFRGLCTGEYGRGAQTNKQLSFVGCKVFRILPGQYIQCGDFEHNDGTGGESVYGGKFKDENFTLWHAHAGVVSMANDGPHRNGSQFFITLKKAAQLNRRHVVFGQVRAGMDLLRALERLPIDMQDRPRVPVFVIGAGIAQKRPRLEGASTSAASRGKRLLRILTAQGQLPNENQEDQKLVEASPDGATHDADQPDPVDVERQLSSTEAEATVAATLNSDVRDEDAITGRWQELKSRVEKGQGLNEMAIKREHKDQQSDSDDGQRTPRKRRMGWSDDPKWYLQETAAVSGKRQERADEKRRNVTFGWDVWNARSVFRAYEGKVKKLRLNVQEYQQQKRALAERFYQVDNLATTPLEHMPSGGGRDRLRELNAHKKRVKRHRMDHDLGDVDYINRQNRAFNKKLESAFGAYTVEIKQNLERGTAL